MVGAEVLLSKGDSNLRAKGLIAGEEPTQAEVDVEAMAMTLSERNGEAAVSVAQLRSEVVVAVEIEVEESNSWVSMSSCIASLAMEPAAEEEEGWVAEGVVTNASLSRSAVDTSLS